MEITRFGALSDQDRAQLEGDEPDPFDAAGIGLTFRPKERHVGVRDETSRRSGSAGVPLAEGASQLARPFWRACRSSVPPRRFVDTERRHWWMPREDAVAVT